MTDIIYNEQKDRVNIAWTQDVIFHPIQAFQKITSYSNAIWKTPLLILSILVLLNVLVLGKLKSQAALSGEISYPPDFQYYTPEQQAQYMQAIQSTQGPVFTYVLPAISGILGIWFSWLIIGGILHLVTTLLGGRGSTAISMNIVAWASIPIAIREFIQIIYMFSTQKMISNPGLSGFSIAGNSGWLLLLSQFLKLIDIYLIWQILLIILGVRFSMGINKTKATAGVLITFLIILSLKTGLSYLFSTLGNLTITRPFFF